MTNQTLDTWEMVAFISEQMLNLESNPEIYGYSEYSFIKYDEDYIDRFYKAMNELAREWITAIMSEPTIEQVHHTDTFILAMQEELKSILQYEDMVRVPNAW